MKTGASGRAKVVVKGKGANLSMPGETSQGSPLPVGEPVRVRVQLRNALHECWESRHTDALGNDETQLRTVGE